MDDYLFTRTATFYLKCENSCPKDIQVIPDEINLKKQK